MTAQLPNHSPPLLASSYLLGALLVLLTSCAGSTQVAPMPLLSSLPDDPERRADVIESARARPAPETRKELPPRARKVETAAATAAAILGILFSESENAMFGTIAPIDENQLVAPTPPAAKEKSEAEESESDDSEGSPDIEHLPLYLRQLGTESQPDGQ